MQPCTSAERTLRQAAARGRTALHSSERDDVEMDDHERSCPPPRPRGPANPWRLVGLLTPRLGRPHAFSPPRRCRRGQWPEATDLDAWSQRRGRPGFAPEFPVCRPHERSRCRPPEPKAECRGRARAVKQIDGTGRGPQGLPRCVGRVANLAGRGRPARQVVPVARAVVAGSAQTVRTALSPPRAQPDHGRKKAAAGFKHFGHRRR